MKKLFLLLSLCFVACAIPVFSYFFDKEYSLNEQKEVPVGGVIMAWQYGTKRVDGAYESKDGYRMELIYTGISQNVIYMLYREYNLESKPPMPGTHIRPAFSHEYRYDISVNKTITFKEVKIQINDATSEALKFTVINGVTEPSKKYKTNSPFYPVEARIMTVNLKDGTKVSGTVLEMNPNVSVILKKADGTSHKILWDNISTMKYE